MSEETTLNTSVPVESSPPVEQAAPPQQPQEKSAAEVMASIWDKAHQARKEDGKFTSQTPAQDDAATTQEPESAEQDKASGAQARQAPKPPVSWMKDKLDLWDKLDPSVQAFIVGREAEVAKGFEKNAEKYRPYEDIDKVLAPYKERWTVEGATPAQRIQQLMAAQDLWEKDPSAFVNHFARIAGIPLGNPSPQQTDGADQNDPYGQQIAALKGELDQLRKRDAERATRDDMLARQSVQSEIDTFLSDKAHPYAADVKKEMGAILGSGQANTLKEAYEKAVWLNPDVRAKVLEDQKKAAAAEAAEAARKAKNVASLNVRSAPGASAVQRTEREALSEVWDRLNA